MTRPVLVTGGTGFLGQRVVRALAARSIPLRLLCRRDPPAELLALAGPSVEVAQGDVRDAVALRRAAAGCRAIVHLAARVARGGRRADFDAVNVQGMRNVLAAAAASEAAADGSVERIVIASSLFALGPSDRAGIAPEGVTEDALDLPSESLDHYQASKRDGALVAREAAQRGAPVIMLFPGLLVGPGPLAEANLVTGMIRDHLCGRFVPLAAGGHHRWSYVHVDDVAEAHVLALEKGVPGTSFVLGGENGTPRELFAIIERLTGRKSPRISLPGPVLWSAGLVEDLLERVFGRAPRQLTRGVARMLCHSWALDSRRAAEQLGWRARSLEATLADTIAWLRVGGHVPS